MTLKTPWTLIDPTDDGSGILARIVTDAEMGHVAVFESPETARATVETMNRAESLEQERGELERELAETRDMLGAKQATIEDQQRQLMTAERELAETRAKLVGLGKSFEEMSKVAGLINCTPAERAVLDAMAQMKHRTLNDVSKRSEFYSPCRAELARRGEKPLAGVRASDWLRELREEDEEKP